MISNDFEERAISDVTLALFEDSGWYQVNYGFTGGLFRFGKNEGCSFVEDKCIIAEQTLHPKEYCIESKANRCMTSHTAKGYCFLLTGIENIPEQYQYFTDKTKGGFGFADFCPIIFPSTDFTKEYFVSNCQIGNKGIYPPGLGEVIGNNSICIESSLAKKGDSSVEDYKGKLIAKCHEVNCDYASNILTVKVNDISFTCQKDGPTVLTNPDYDGEFHCPEYSRVCTNEKNYCNNLITCLGLDLSIDGANYKFFSIYLLFSLIFLLS